jgi:hypothetical protein
MHPKCDSVYELNAYEYLGIGFDKNIDESSRAIMDWLKSPVVIPTIRPVLVGGTQIKYIVIQIADAINMTADGGSIFEYCKTSVFAMRAYISFEDLLNVDSEIAVPISGKRLAQKKKSHAFGRKSYIVEALMLDPH